MNADVLIANLKEKLNGDIDRHKKTKDYCVSVGKEREAIYREGQLNALYEILYFLDSAPTAHGKGEGE